MEYISATNNENNNVGISNIKEALKDGGWAFFDIDGTLEDGNGIPPNIPDALNALIHNGIQLGISTSRSSAEVKRFFQKMGISDRELFTGWKFLEDSHVIIEPGHSLEDTRIITTSDTLQEMKVFADLFTSKWSPIEELPTWGFLEGLPNLPVQLSPYPHLGSVSIWEKGPYESPEYLLMMEWALKVAVSLGMKNVDFFESGDGTLRLFQRGINKATAIKIFSDSGLIDLKRTVYFGDANNDLAPAAIIKEGGGAVVAVANGTTDFKKIATYTTSRQSGSGVIEVIEQLYS